VEPAGDSSGNLPHEASLDWDSRQQHPFSRHGGRALAKDLGISGTPGFILGTELVLKALDPRVLKELIERARNRK